ncbi:FAD binding domain protein [Rutstroemia sp. NJR-2017a BBW]|nr:FAD binding domain protein [Rutstroemia sp. NJR-2017a BBW]
MGIIVRLIGSGIGLASEAIHHHRNKSATSLARSPEQAGESSRAGAQNNSDDPPPEYVEVSTEDASRLIAQGKAIPADTKEKHDFQTEERDEEDSDSDSDSEQGDEEQWALDEAADRSRPSTPSGEPTQDAGKLIDTFIRNHPRPASSGPQPKLPCPVILPQRRPKDKKRGFIRAYAPLLQDCGIDQATFLEFLETFYQSSKSSPWLNVINAAAAIVGFVPGPITMGVSIATQFAVGVAMELQSRSRSVVMPESAPLIFPALEQKIAMEGDENVKKENAMKRTGNFINDYMDRRAQAAYVRVSLTRNHDIAPGQTNKL